MYSQHKDKQPAIPRGVTGKILAWMKPLNIPWPLCISNSIKYTEILSKKIFDRNAVS